MESVTATAEFLPGSDENEKIVIVSSNRSWYAHLNDVDLQEGAVYHLQAVPDKTDANCDQDVINISVDCNTVWSDQIVSATANVSLYNKGIGYEARMIIISNKP